MTEELIYWRHPTVPGIKVEEISGGDKSNQKIWLEMARQIYCENGKEAYREIGHFKNGAPFLFGEASRISITHCRGLLAIATLPPTPEVDLDEFNERSAMGIDAERSDRSQVIKIREKFLSDSELKMLPADNVELNIQAWTAKEALYKAVMQDIPDFRNNIRILRLPEFGPATPVFDYKEFNLDSSQKTLPERFFGEAEVVINYNGVSSDESLSKLKISSLRFRIFSYKSDDFIITLVYSPRCAKFGKTSGKNS